ncbi:MAG: peptidase T [Clostridia bacterium]|nr:peptidase T [Clostridia bacterium]
MKIEERFLNYVGYPTMSDEESESTPSTQKQTVLAKALAEELREIGVSDAEVDGHGYVYGSIPATAEGFSSVGFIAHLDTSDAMPDSPIKTRVVDYGGGDILLNEEKGIVMREADYPALSRRVGERLIVTDGTTLLGADDKAGITEIVSAAERIIKGNFPHGKISIAFTPDEEIGRGADLFDVKKFGADYAYTLDGGEIGELEYENFNAASAKVSVKGFSIHPGSAKGKMKNASSIAAEFNSLLDPEAVPEKTEGYEGFYHLISMSGECEYASLDYILRDHDGEKLEALKLSFESLAHTLNEKYGEGTVTLTVKDSYRNMREIIEAHPYTIEGAKSAMKKLGIEPIVNPIRGGTDGARLSFMGLPCPNLGTGGANFHSGFEYVSIDGMERAVDLIVEIIKGAKSV